MFGSSGSDRGTRRWWDKSLTDPIIADYLTTGVWPPARAVADADATVKDNEAAVLQRRAYRNEASRIAEEARKDAIHRDEVARLAEAALRNDEATKKKKAAAAKSAAYMVAWRDRSSNVGAPDPSAAEQVDPGESEYQEESGVW